MTKISEAILREVKDFPARERAAAIAHYVYMMTANRTPDWDERVPFKWAALPESARALNLSSSDTWASEPSLTDAWIAAIRELTGG